METACRRFNPPVLEKVFDETEFNENFNEMGNDLGKELNFEMKLMKNNGVKD